MIITREVGAERIELKVLQDFVRQNKNGWGIAYYDDKHTLKFLRNFDMSKFIDTFRDKENQDFQMLAYLKNRVSGTNTYYNLPPLSIMNVGLLIVDNVDSISMIGTGLVLDPDESDELIIANMFRKFSENNPNLTPIQKWNKFISINEQFLADTKLVMMFQRTKKIVYHNSEKGLFYNKNKIWISEGEIIDIEDEMSAQLCDIYFKMENYQEVMVNELIGLSFEELVFLFEEFPEHLALQLKHGISGYPITNKIIDSCFDCNKLIREGGGIEVPYQSKYVMICKKCFETNP